MPTAAQGASATTALALLAGGGYAIGSNVQEEVKEGGTITLKENKQQENETIRPGKTSSEINSKSEQVSNLPSTLIQKETAPLTQTDSQDTVSSTPSLAPVSDVNNSLDSAPKSTVTSDPKTASDVNSANSVETGPKDAPGPVPEGNSNPSGPSTDLRQPADLNDLKGQTVKGTVTVHKQLTEPEKVTTFDAKTDPGSDYQNKILGLTKKENLPHLVKAKETTNKTWWDWAYQDLYEQDKNKKGQLDPIFYDLEKGYEAIDGSFKVGDTHKSLNKACEKAYRQGKDKYSFESGNNLLKNISKYCTKGATEHDISEPNSTTFTKEEVNKQYSKGHLLTAKDNETKFVKPDSINDLWWKWAYKNRIKTQEQTNYTKVFKTVDKAIPNSSQQNDNNALNKACDLGYKKELVREFLYDDEKLLNEMKKLCALKSNDSRITTPTWAEPGVGKRFVSDNTNPSQKAKFNVGVAAVSANKDKLVDPNHQVEWWGWSYYTNFFKKPTERTQYPAPFNGISSRYSLNGTNTTALNKACEEAYKKSKNEVTKPTTYNQKTLLDLIKNFCVPTNKGSLQPPQQ